MVRPVNVGDPLEHHTDTFPPHAAGQLVTQPHPPARSGPALVEAATSGESGVAATSPPVNHSGRWAHVDAMRAVAVLLVVLAHAGLASIVPGNSGVTIFFSISGFIITYLLLQEHERTGSFSARSFYRRRLYKIGPPLVVAVVIPTLIWMAWRHVSTPAFLSQIFFAYNWAYGANPDVLPGSEVVWSLAIEEQFYIGLALLWPWIIRGHSWQTRLRWTAWAAVVYATVSRLILAALGSDHWLRIYYGTDTRIDGIALGILAALLLHNAQKNAPRARRLMDRATSDGALIAAVLLFLASLAIRDEFFRDTFRYSMQSVATCLVILYGFGSRRTRLQAGMFRVATWRPVQLIGLASYSIYLGHKSVQLLLGQTHLLDGDQALSIVVKVLAGLTAGLALYFAVEVPAARVKRSRDRLTRVGTGSLR
jgi:peptidoglycan/LPS O-acetylase OafA/YrhL